jgi:aminoglycoside phosphotransferase (APT) family kinase protein
MDHFTGSGAVAQQHAFDVSALERWLSANLQDFAGPLTVEQFKGGQSNPTYKLLTPGRTYVMRAKPGPKSKLLPSAHAIEREYRVMDALALSVVPVARMRVLCDDESVIGRAFYLMDFVEGRVLWDQSLPGMANDERAAVYDEMNRVMAALHSVEVKSVGLSDFGRPGNYFGRQIKRWSQQYKDSTADGKLSPIPDMDRLLAWLPEHMPASALDESQIAIVHGDYRLDNLIFHPKEPRVIAVLDWELSTIGHPLADFSYHCMSWRIPPGVFRGIGGLDLPALGIPSEHDYVRRYCERTGRGAPDALLADWNFYLAYNLFRLAAICQGIARRVVDGTAASAQARATGEATRPLAELGWAVASRA